MKVHLPYAVMKIGLRSVKIKLPLTPKMCILLDYYLAPLLDISHLPTKYSCSECISSFPGLLMSKLISIALKRNLVLIRSLFSLDILGVFMTSIPLAIKPPS